MEATADIVGRVVVDGLIFGATLGLVKPQLTPRLLLNYLNRGETQLRLDLTARIRNFNYPTVDEDILQSHKVASILTSVLSNSSDSETVTTFEERVATTSQFSWELSQNLKIFATVKSQGGIPLLANANLEAGTEINVGARQQWGKETRKELVVTHMVNLRPRSSVKVLVTVEHLENLELNFTAELEVRGTKEGSSTPASGDDIIEALLKSGGGYSPNKIVRVGKDHVFVRVNGTLTGNYGHRAKVDTCQNSPN